MEVDRPLFGGGFSVFSLRKMVFEAFDWSKRVVVEDVFHKYVIERGYVLNGGRNGSIWWMDLHVVKE